ncbi:MAG TPA: hypothetical protein VFD13_04040 [Candidatus Kapabacteria bacterium]|nr:hypothetical protein [Candidatus Kapabacteria bacterium]
MPSLALGQSFVNPDTIYQSGDIILQNTDAYYNPFAPPGDSDTRENLSNQSDLLRDPNGVGNQWRDYLPIIYDSAAHKFDTLSNWAPYGTPLGGNVVWQRLFTARDKQDHTHSDIIVGSSVVIPDTTYDTLSLDGSHWITMHITNPSGPVTISKNEDVDFRASGTVKMENGFHVHAGAFFHAYQEPRWDTAVFSDEFNDTAKFRSQWIIANGNSDNYGTMAFCSFDTDVRLWPDSEAHDGWALDVMLREDTVDTCSCHPLSYLSDSCGELADTLRTHQVKNIFSSSIIRSCPWPWSSVSRGSLGGPAYAHAPYGKYEIRDKIPHVFHHTNNWGAQLDGEWDMNETPNATMGIVCPGWGHHFRFGPFNGIFKKEAHDTLFISPAAGWGAQSHPLGIMINNFLYLVKLAPGHNKDTVVATGETQYQGGFPASLVNSTDSISFYYERSVADTSDNVTWTVTTDGGGKWDVFHAPYHVVSPGDSLFFSKDYQPTSATLTTSHIPFVQKTFDCRWDHTLNAVLLNPSGDSAQWAILNAGLHTNTEAYGYAIVDLYNHLGYPIPGVMIDRDTLPDDTAAYARTPYKYHTFSMEWLPHEVRFLIDSNVVRRIPDRLTPPGTPYSDWATTGARSPANIRPAEFDIDVGNGSDPLGTDDTVAYLMSDGTQVFKSITYYERKYFESHTHNPGFWDVNGRPAAHHLLDYVKIWDLPSDMIVPKFPQ